MHKIQRLTLSLTHDLWLWLWMALEPHGFTMGFYHGTVRIPNTILKQPVTQ